MTPSCLFSGNPADAVRQAETVLTGLKETMVIGDGGDHNFMANGITGYRQAQQLAFAMRAEDALACPELPVETRRELRRWLAIYANLGSEPDFNPRGSGVHLGNNNMSYNRTLMLTYFAALLPDHPCQAYWLERIRAFCEYKFATEFGWDGASLECPAYQLYAPARALIVAQTALRNLGVANLSKGGALRANLQFLANLTMPDARIGNKRILPGMGNSPNCLESIWGIAMAAEEGDAVFAGWLKSMHRLAKGSITENQGQAGGGDWNCYPLFYRPAVPDQPVQFASTFMPTYGLVFRAHFGTPLETAMLLRAGGNWGHWDTDALNVILYGQRAPLSPGTGYQYLANPAPQLDNGIYHNRVKVGQRDLQEVFGRVDAGIADYGFAEWADYAVADRYYPPELFADGKGEMHWRRHVLFLKSAKPEGANYFVMRDTFPGGEARPKWWNWLNLDGSDLISVDGQAFARAEMNKVVGEGDMPKKTGQVVELKTTYGASTWFWFSRPVEVRIRMTFDAAAQGSVPAGMEVKTIVEIPAGAGEDFFYVVWPRPDGASVPKCQLLAPGVIQIETAEATDYAFLADKPLTFHRDGITFQGAAGAVRQAAGGAPAGLLTVSPGPRLVTDLGRGVTVSGEGPFEARLEGDVIKLKVSGRTRMLHMTQPSFIVRPDYRVDGRQSMACWTDYPASGWGSYKNSWLIALPVPTGDHELTVSNLRFPPGWARQFIPRIRAGAER
jgi:hypothetical protein